jgi:hypothetical protein
MKHIFVFVYVLFLPLIIQAQTNYSNYAQMSQRVQRLAQQYPQVVQRKTLTKTVGGKDILMLTIGSGETEKHPALAVVGGVEGSHQLGIELALRFAEQLAASANTDSIKTLLANHTFYVFPNMSPDASEQYFASFRFSRNGNAKDTDDDRDGKMNEDGFEDLDGNGVITMMRIQDPIGRFKLYPDDARLVVPADASKGEKGGYQYMNEGTDNDKDGKWNEDGVGGVYFNRNMSYNYPNFTQGAGEYMVSENESRALLDFLFDAANVYAVMTFSSTNNLSNPVAFNPQAVAKRVITGYYEADAKANAMVSEVYNKTTNTKDAPKTQPSGGDFSQWAYFHYGRFSFSTPAWWIPKADAATKTPDDPIAQYLAFAKVQNITGTFYDWKTVNHPDFPNQKVEVGGVDPFVLTNPPFALVNDIAKNQNAFIIKLAGMRPQMDIVNLKKEAMGNGLTRITVDVLNKGALPTNPRIAEQNNWVKRLNVSLKLAPNQRIVSGRPSQLINAIEGFGSKQLTWLIQGAGNVSLEVGSASVGTKKIDISL